MKHKPWTVGLAAAGLVSFAPLPQAEEGHNVITALSSTRISGYVDTSIDYTFGSGNSNMGGIPGRTFYNGYQKADGFNFNVAKVSLSKPVDEGNWTAGYQLDLLFGPDAANFNPSVFTMNSDPSAVGGTDFDEIGIKQAYVALRAPVGNGLDFKVGVFDTIIGYEVFESPNNPNFSRSYGFNIEPFQHTGAIASYQLNDYIGIAGGIANTGFVSSINARPTRAGLPTATQAVSEWEKAYLGAVTFEIPEDVAFLGGGAIYGGVVDGLAGGAEDTTNWYVGSTIPTPIDGLNLGAGWDYQTGDAVAGDGVDDSAMAAALYLSYAFTDDLTFNGRLDYVRYDASSTLFPVSDGSRDELFGMTGTIDYTLWDNVLTRLEFRMDRDITGTGTPGQKPFNNPAAPGTDPDKNIYSLTLNFVYQF